MRPKFGVAGPNTSAEVDRGAQNLHYDFWWNLPSDYMVTGDLGVPRKVVLLELLGPSGPAQCQTIDISANHQMGVVVGLRKSKA